MGTSEWHRSSFCGGGGNNCVEVAATDSHLALRESEDPTRVLAPSGSTFRALLSTVKAEPAVDRPE